MFVAEKTIWCPFSVEPTRARFWPHRRDSRNINVWVCCCLPWLALPTGCYDRSPLRWHHCRGTNVPWGIIDAQKPWAQISLTAVVGFEQKRLCTCRVDVLEEVCRESMEWQEAARETSQASCTWWFVLMLVGRCALDHSNSMCTVQPCIAKCRRYLSEIVILRPLRDVDIRMVMMHFSYIFPRIAWMNTSNNFPERTRPCTTLFRLLYTRVS